MKFACSEMPKTSIQAFSLGSGPSAAPAWIWPSRSSVGCVCPRSYKHWHMIVSFSFLDVEFDLNFWPEAFDASLLIPQTNFEFDAPRRSFTVLELAHHLIQGRRYGWYRLPLFNAAIFIRHSSEADPGMLSGYLATPGGRWC